MRELGRTFKKGYNLIMKKHEFTICEKIILRETLETKTFFQKSKKFIIQTISGWFPSLRKDLSPEGVYKLQIVDRKNNFYKKYVTDQRTGRVIKDIEEKLTLHHNK
jgi:hypothetical protein